MSKDLPTSSFDVLLQKLVVVVELSGSGGELTPQGRQALLQSVRPTQDRVCGVLLKVNGHTDKRSQGRP